MTVQVAPKEPTFDATAPTVKFVASVALGAIVAVQRAPDRPVRRELAFSDYGTRILLMVIAARRGDGVTLEISSMADHTDRLYERLAEHLDPLLGVNAVPSLGRIISWHMPADVTIPDQPELPPPARVEEIIVEAELNASLPGWREEFVAEGVHAPGEHRAYGGSCSVFGGEASFSEASFSAVLADIDAANLDEDERAELLKSGGTLPQRLIRVAVRVTIGGDDILQKGAIDPNRFAANHQFSCVKMMGKRGELLVGVIAIP